MELREFDSGVKWWFWNQRKTCATRSHRTQSTGRKPYPHHLHLAHPDRELDLSDSSDADRYSLPDSLAIPWDRHHRNAGSTCRPPVIKLPREPREYRIDLVHCHTE